MPRGRVRVLSLEETGKVLTMLRVGWTQAKIAYFMGVSPATISRVCRGIYSSKQGFATPPSLAPSLTPSLTWLDRFWVSLRGVFGA